MSQSNPLNAVIDLLLKPVPFLPAASFVSGVRSDPRYASKMRTARKNRALSKNLKNDSGYTLKGVIERGASTPYAIEGEDFSIDSDTWIFGEVRVGAQATVLGVRHAGVTFARKILIQ